MTDAPIACDMRTAEDTPEERLLEYRRLFGTFLLGRRRLADGVELRFDPAARPTVEDLARREALCCPFLEYRVETIGDELVWTTTGDDRPGVAAILDAFHALPDGDFAFSAAAPPRARGRAG